VPQLDAWANFYVIVGSSAAGLTGLQFVVLTLVAQSRATPGREAAVAAFGSPNVAHFSAALLVSSLLSMPWRTPVGAGIAVAVVGIAGLVYCAVVAMRARRQTSYAPVLEDWISHTILPPVAYIAVTAAGFALPAGDVPLFGVAGGVLLLVLIGIHNAWDTVTYVIASAERAGDRGRD